MEKRSGMEPKVLIWDVETSPLLSYTWALFDQNVALNQIKSDWHLLSWAAKWLGDAPSKVIYMDQRHAKNVEDDKRIMQGLWDLLDEADVVVTQNGKQFDAKKVNARFILNGLKPPSPYKHLDTLQMAKRNFAFTSNKLEYMSDKLCAKNKKLKTKEFSGFDLWRECLAGNRRAWDEMRRYNIADVLATEELYLKLAPWGASVDLNVFRPGEKFLCQCGSENLQKRGFDYTRTGKFQKYRCADCGAWKTASGAANNLFTKEKKKSLRGP